ncbi:hypothetical protein FJD37_10860 [Pseudomonas saxonica]|uniref:Uncharacterized protein n=1 Tax=Pseudomonas saxonica TaxID=2600598 RepID=A0A5C5PY73_9PSED|nr:hypothetical protein FJD37_10860 [Pseudomonas saxonica]
MKCSCCGAINPAGRWGRSH